MEIVVLISLSRQSCLSASKGQCVKITMDFSIIFFSNVLFWFHFPQNVHQCEGSARFTSNLAKFRYPATPSFLCHDGYGYTHVFSMMVTDTLTKMHFRKCMSVSVCITMMQKKRGAAGYRDLARLLVHRAEKKIEGQFGQKIAHKSRNSCRVMVGVWVHKDS